MAAEVRSCTVDKLKVKAGRQRILNGISFEISRGEPFAIVGRSGSGKTTLLYAMLGLVPLEEGRVAYGSIDLARLSHAKRADICGLVFQDYQLFPHLTVRENLLLAPRARGLAIGEKEAAALLEELGIGKLADRFPAQISGGQKQRVAIARSLILEPDFLFLDEPSAALDSESTRELANLLRRLNERSQVVVVSHDHPFLEILAPAGIRLEKGAIKARGNLKELFV